MKDEIKEINIPFPGQILDYVDTKEHLLELFNYITNLQESEAYYYGQYKDYKSRNDKAIGILNKLKNEGEEISWIEMRAEAYCNDINNIIRILKGE